MVGQIKQYKRKPHKAKYALWGFLRKLLLFNHYFFREFLMINYYLYNIGS